MDDTQGVQTSKAIPLHTGGENDPPRRLCAELLMVDEV